ncbi:S9 family peptidase [Kangiella profundi]|uniref:S9 family peptidase n=1 Tax=Kangiella profundi TaxID=1561924 RepID=A0A2K9APF1_9GAMM|nr:S9 family peptidase [Kangiella profundi]AUD79502.1 S9 family peptidase [Kangiella profundi]GGE97977.1 peptidase S9 [Kangiella profundi]
MKKQLIPQRLVQSLLGCALLVSTAVSTAASAAIQAQPLTLNKVMSDPDWIGNAPENAYWHSDGQSIYYQQKLVGNKEKAWYQLDLTSKQTKKLSDKELLERDGSNGVLSQNKLLKAYNLNGDLYVRYLESGEVRQLTKTLENEGTPIFIGNQSVAYRQGNSFYSINLNDGLISHLVDVRLEENPDKEQEKSFLDEQQTRYFDYIRQQQEQREHDKKRKQQIAESSERDAPQPWYLGKDKEIRTLSLSPNGRYVIVGTYDKSDKTGKSDNMPRFVTEDGYVENQEVRALVGTYEPRHETLHLLDLQTREQFELSYEDLPYIEDDPLADIKRDTARRQDKKYEAHEGIRNVSIFNWGSDRGLQWSPDGNNALFMLFSADNKDRWIATIDFDDKELENQHHMRDKAWINDWNFNDFGWINNKSIYYTSEESGFSHLYTKTLNRSADALTKGRYVVDSVNLSPDNKFFYYRANKKHPGIFEVYRVAVDGGESQAVTNLGGLNDYTLSPDGSQLIIEHSEATRPADLYLVSAKGGEATQLTDTVSDEFKSVNWTQPEYVEIPSRDVDMPIHARLYKPADFDAERAEQYPAVIFIHGAGYLQNAHQGWSLYFREFMFHSFLTQQGYVVLDIDYRGSANYGRDWRTAIYRRMGTPEVVDLQDGANWMASNVNVDRRKVGIYGGSYGGFLTFMGLFTAPDEFAAGASLRPVTDWAHYNHGYTSNILNTPEVDPVAYERSSPIEFAEGLNKPLLIAHGMVDDNVFFKDTVRLVQRLIELEKTEYFETAIYPIEPHGFTEPSSWLDEYKRIYYLFERHLK